MQFLIGVLILCLLQIPVPAAARESDPFPRFASIEANVAFWKKVYAEYPSTKGFIHDGEDLSIIYEIISVEPRDIPGASKRNRAKIKKIKARYRALLQDLARGRVKGAQAKRVLALFGEKASAARLRRAAAKVRFQLCQQDRFRAGLVRSGRYLDEIKRIFRSHSLPVDLAYLPHVESSFNYEAYSKFGAAGIWQFIRATGRRFLTISYTVDERRDPIAATHAAAGYLKENYRKLGSWPLALTAYNHGANSMLRAKKRHGGYEEIYLKYQNKRFGFASRNFYAEFLAAREIARDYQRYFPGLVLDTPVQAVEIPMRGYAAVDDIVRHFGIDVNTLKEFNPALRPPVFAGRKYIPKGYVLRLPASTAQVASLPESLYKPHQKRSRFYRVARGDTAGKIARMHRVSLRDLIESNQLDRRATIYVGQNLRIPAPGEKVRPAAKPVAEAKLVSGGRKKRPAPAGKAKAVQTGKKTAPPEAAVAERASARPVPEKEATVAKTVAVAAPPEAGQGGQKRETAAGEKGETAAEKGGESQPAAVAKTAAATPEKELPLMRAPEKSPPAALPLPLASVHTPAGREETAAEEVVREGAPAVEQPPPGLALLNPELVLGNFSVLEVFTENGRQVGVVQVEYLETLGHYADWLEIPTQTIRNLNKLPFGRRITARKKIKIPFGKVGRELFEERRYEFHKEVEEDFYSAYQVVGIQTYTVKRGDTIWDLCHDTFDLPFWLLQRFNPKIDIGALRPGQKLTVPVVEARENAPASEADTAHGTHHELPEARPIS